MKWTDSADKVLLDLAKNHTQASGRVDWFSVHKNWNLELYGDRSRDSLSSRYDKLIHNRVSGINDPEVPTLHDIFTYIRDEPKSLEEISNRFDRSPKHVLTKLEAMEESGYLIVRADHGFAVKTITRPRAKKPDVSIAELMGREFTIAIASDLHAASRHCQPTFYNQFIKYAVEEYGVRHIFNPGDTFSGMYGYRGQDEDLIPSCRPMSRKKAWAAVNAQVELADMYIPKYDDVLYYNLGGNHDYFITKTTGMDAVKLLCDRRDDMIYGGYDVWGVPLTEHSYVRLWHPSGGVSYARSYRVQKGMEALAYEALRESMAQELPPYVSILMTGHLHLTAYVPDPPLFGMLCGTFEGQTNYMKQKNLVPHIAGIILEIKLDANDKIAQVGYTPRFSEEVKDDWKNWPVPEQIIHTYEPDQLDILFSATEAEEPTS